MLYNSVYDRCEGVGDGDVADKCVTLYEVARRASLEGQYGSLHQVLRLF